MVIIADEISMDHTGEEEDFLYENDAHQFIKNFLQTVRKLVSDVEDSELSDNCFSSSRQLNVNACEFVPSNSGTVYGKSDVNISETRLLEISTMLYNAGLDLNERTENQASSQELFEISGDKSISRKDGLWSRGLRFHNRHSSASDKTSLIADDENSWKHMDCSSGDSEGCSPARVESRNSTDNRFTDSRTSEVSSFVNSGIDIEQLRFWALSMKNSADQILNILDRGSTISLASFISPPPRQESSSSMSNPSSRGSQSLNSFNSPGSPQPATQQPRHCTVNQHHHGSYPSNLPTFNQRSQPSIPTPMEGHIINMANNLRKSYGRKPY